MKMSRLISLVALSIIPLLGSIGPAANAQSAYTLPQDAVGQQPATSWRPRFIVLPRKRTAGVLPAVKGPTVPFWQRNFKLFDNNTYTIKMVGKNPYVQQAHPKTTVDVVVIPISVEFTVDNITLDPTNPPRADRKCFDSGKGTPLQLELQSPVFKSTTFKAAVSGVTSTLGTGQLTDVFQQNNFFKFTKSGAINAAYALNLSVATGAKLRLTVNGSTTINSAWCGHVAGLNVNSLDAILQSTIESMKSQGVGPTVFPFFVLYNIVMCDSGGCGIGGYHSAFANSQFNNATQTYGIADFDTSGIFSSGQGEFMDVFATGHEVSEWVDDPFVDNVVPAWGNIGQVTGCYPFLETGDPLSNGFPVIKIKMPNGFTYHNQDEAFASWFFRDRPSIGFKGWYSMFGQFQTDAGRPACT